MKQKRGVTYMNVTPLLLFLYYSLQGGTYGKSMGSKRRN